MLRIGLEGKAGWLGWADRSLLIGCHQFLVRNVHFLMAGG